MTVIVSVVDAENRLRLYKRNGHGLEELGQLRVVSTDPNELAAITTTLAAMAGEDVEDRPKERKKIKAAKVEPKALPPAPAKRRSPTPQPIKVNPDYLPDLGSNGGRTLLLIEERGPMHANDIAAEFGWKPGNVSAALSNYKAIGVVEVAETFEGAQGRTMFRYGLSKHGRESIDRARAHALT